MIKYLLWMMGLCSFALGSYENHEAVWWGGLAGALCVFGLWLGVKEINAESSGKTQ